MTQQERPGGAIGVAKVPMSIEEYVYGGEIPLDEAMRANLARQVYRTADELSPEEYSRRRDILSRNHWLMQPDQLADAQQVQMATSYEQLPRSAQEMLGTTDIRENFVAWGALKRYSERRLRLHASIANAQKHERSLQQRRQQALRGLLRGAMQDVELPAPPQSLQSLQPLQPLAIPGRPLPPRRLRFPEVPLTTGAVYPVRPAIGGLQGGWFSRLRRNVASSFRWLRLQPL